MKGHGLPIAPRVICILTIALTLAGCGDSGPERFELSGQATYDGKPIPAGVITFEPEGTTLNASTIGEAEIKDGRYKTLPTKGIVGGRHTVFVAGYNGIPEPGSGPYGASLFAPVYKTSEQFPLEASTFDFEVPKNPGGK